MYFPLTLWGFAAQLGYTLLIVHSLVFHVTICLARILDRILICTIRYSRCGLNDGLSPLHPVRGREQDIWIRGGKNLNNDKQI